MRELTSPEEYSSFVETNDLCGVYFYTTTCGICHVLKPKVAEVFEEVGIPIAKVNLMELSSLAGPMLIMGVPTLIVLLNGVEQEREGAYMQMPDLQAKLEKLRRHLV